MTNYIPTEDINEPTDIGLFILPNSFAYIGQNISVVSPHSDAIFTDENVTVQVDGRAIGAFGLFTNSDHVTFLIGETGVVSGHSRAINLAGSDGYVDNAGSIFDVSVGVYFDGFNNELHNSGKIAVGAGFPNTDNAAVQLIGLDGGHYLVDNSGLIDSGGSTKFAIQSFVGASADTIINTGTIRGLVSLDAGNDLLDTSRGTLTGVIDMGAGNDTVRGSAVADNIFSGAGKDQLVGNAGNDRLTGGHDADLLTGGTGADLFIFKPGDTGVTAATEDHITDFTHAQADRVDLRSIDASTAISGDQQFTFIGKQAFHKHAGELHFSVSAGHVVVSGDVNGDAKADFVIVLDHVTTITAADFLL